MLPVLPCGLSKHFRRRFQFLKPQINGRNEKQEDKNTYPDSPGRKRREGLVKILLFECTEKEKEETTYPANDGKKD
jgi:hypothetical protein